MDKIPVNDTIIYSLARLVDDAQKDRRDPSHSDIQFQINRSVLQDGDPNKDGSPVGKVNRVRGFCLSSIMDKGNLGLQLIRAPRPLDSFY